MCKRLQVWVSCFGGYGVTNPHFLYGLWDVGLWDEGYRCKGLWECGMFV
nr:MAG TPA: hypothetical protein [Caudoviricetes sp.]